MEEAYNIVKELAQWSNDYKYEFGHQKRVEMYNKLEDLEEKAKQFINTNPTQP
jgi:hypothetical protein